LKLKAILILLAVLAVAGITYVFINRPKPPPETEPKYYVWDFKMDDLQHVILSLPKVNQSESFVKHADDRNFYFDVANGPKVDMQRWGGGIPLLLSGPGATRLIMLDAPDAKLTEYGFNKPSMTAQLELIDGNKYDIQVGDINPEGTTYYVRLASNKDVYTVDKTWYDVLSGIVSDPPYVPGALVVDVPTVAPTEVAVGAPATVSVKVSNGGDVKGTFDVTLLVNSTLADTKSVTLEARSSQVVTFTVTEKAAGKYVVSINAKHNATFTVK
jgi:hypothetical protein